MTTRLEAFAEMFSRQGCAGGRKPQDADHCGARSPARPEPRTVLPSAHGPIVGIPSMGTSAVTLKALFEGIGAQVEMGPPASKRTLILGAGCTPEFMSTPYKQLIGNMIEMLEAGADTLVYVDGLDQCRTSSYPQMMEDALCDLGYRFQFAIFTEIFKGGIFAMPRYLRRFAPEVTWRDILREMGLAIARMQAIDDVERRVQYLRPREAPGGGVEKVWEEALGRLGNARGREDLKRAKADILLKLDKIPREPDARPVQVGLTGEIFAVLDAFYNQDIERELSRASSGGA